MGAEPPVLEIKGERADGLYKAGETIRFKVRFLRNGQPLVGMDLRYKITGDGGLKQSGALKSAATPQTIETKMERPGILICTVTGKDDATGKAVSAKLGAGVDVFKITPGMPKPDDLDEFWKKAKAELAAVPIKVLYKKEIPVPGYIPAATRTYLEKKGGVKLYDIRIACAGGMPVSGYLAEPVKMEKGKCPGSVTFAGAPGYFAAVWVPLSTAGIGGIGLSINAHGVDNGISQEAVKEHRKKVGSWFRDDPKQVYIFGMALRALRALQYIKSLPEWNGKDLTVSGGSMGGGQALLAAALDEDVSFCDATAPTFCDWAGGLKQQRSGWPAALTKPKQIKAAAYYDLANLCTYIKAPTVIRTGFLDHLCAPTGHYAIYNRMTCPKLIFHNPGAGHNIQWLNLKEDLERLRAFRKKYRK